jgi:hypothetical protein
LCIERFGSLALPIAAAGLLLGCVRKSVDTSNEVIATELPRATEWAQVPGPESWRGHGGMAVSPSGVLAFTISGKDADPRFAYLDSAGKVLATFSRTGDGPGEVRAIGGLWFDGDTLGGFDLMTQRATRFDRDGRVLEIIQIAGIGQPSGMGPTGLVTVLIGKEGPEIMAIAPGGEADPLLERGDAAYDSIVRAPFREVGEEDRMPMPALAVRGNTIAFADA